MKLWKKVCSVIGVAGVISCAEPTQADVLDRIAFRDAFIAQLRKALPDAEVSVAVEPVVVEGETLMLERVSVTPTGDEERHVYLDQGYKRYLDGESADAVISSLVALVMQPSSPPYKPDQAYLLVRPVEFLDFFKNSDDEQRRPVSLPLAGDLIILLGQDMGEAYTYPLRENVLEHHDDVQAAWVAAMQRTLSSFGDIQLQADGEIHMLTARSDIAASMLVDDAVWKSEGVAALSQAPVVAVFRDALIIADGLDPNAVQRLKYLVINNKESPTLLSDELYIRRNNRWAVLN